MCIWYRSNKILPITIVGYTEVISPITTNTQALRNEQRLTIWKHKLQHRREMIFLRINHYAL